MSTSEKDWSDHNASDPGITILEAMVYGLTGLAGAVRGQFRERQCGWRCAVLLGAGAVGALIVLRRARRGTRGVGHQNDAWVS